MSGLKTTTHVFIDGFNLYYGCLRGTPHKWLDLQKLCTMLLPGCSIEHIHYYTSLVVPPPEDQGQLQRQLTYLRALRTISCLSVHLGQFHTHRVRRPLADSPDGGRPLVTVFDTKEKGSDVALASHLVFGGCQRHYEMAAVFSADSDLAEPVRLVTEELGIPVVVLHPFRSTSAHLQKFATQYRPIRERALRACQFPAQMTDAVGTIYKPSRW